jgi:sn-glycerol 3-phosphate transport system substrate-binding protein
MKKVGVACMLFVAASLVFAQSPIKVSFWYSVGGTVRDAVERCIKEYNASQNKYQIEGVFAGNYEESLQKIISAIASGSAPVLIQQAHVYAPQLIDANTLEPLDSYIAKDKTFQRDQFIEPLFQSNVINGKTYGVAFNCSTPIMYYNKDLFRKAGLNPEKFPATWPELYEAAKKLTALGKDSYGYVLSYGSGWILEGLVWEFGAEWMAKDNSKVLWNEKAHVDAVKFYKKLIDQKVAIYKGGEPDFMSGKAAIFMESTASLTRLKGMATFDLGTAEFPAGTRKAVPLGGGSLYIFRRNSKALKDGAWDFIRFMTSKETQMEWAAATGYLVVRKDAKEALETDGFLKKDKRYTTTYLQLPYIHPENETAYPYFLSLRSIYNDAWDKIMMQGTDVQATFDEAAKKANAVIEENK